MYSFGGEGAGARESTWKTTHVPCTCMPAYTYSAWSCFPLPRAPSAVNYIFVSLFERAFEPRRFEILFRSTVKVLGGEGAWRTVCPVFAYAKYSFRLVSDTFHRSGQTHTSSVLYKPKSYVLFRKHASMLQNSSTPHRALGNSLSDPVGGNVCEDG